MIFSKHQAGHSPEPDEIIKLIAENN